MLKLLIKFVIGILIIPVAAGSTIAFYNHITHVKDIAANMRFFLWGLVSYLILHIFFYKPTYVYVFGHEAVHAATAWLFGGSIKSFKVGKDGGSVKTDKSNFVIELSPYFVPLYAIIILCVYVVISASYRVNGSVFIFLIGFALSFHLASTAEILKIRQPDIMKSGYIFSIALVYLLNLAVIGLVFGGVFPDFNAARYFADSLKASGDIYARILSQAFL